MLARSDCSDSLELELDSKGELGGGILCLVAKYMGGLYTNAPGATGKRERRENKRKRTAINQTNPQILRNLRRHEGVVLPCPCRANGRA
jgi:hypothetical protein